MKVLVLSLFSLLCAAAPAPSMIPGIVPIAGQLESSFGKQEIHCIFFNIFIIDKMGNPVLTDTVNVYCKLKNCRNA